MILFFWESATHNRTVFNLGEKMKKITTILGALAASVLVSCASAPSTLSGAAGSPAKASVSSQTISVTESDEAAFQLKVNARYSAISIKDFGDGFNHARYAYPNSIPPWELYDTDQIAGFAENMVYLQNPDGGWAKNLDLQRKFSLSELFELREKNLSIPPVTWHKMKDKKGSTIDNGNIFSQIKYLAQVYKQIPEPRYLECMTKAVQWILNAQHPGTGGFTGADVEAITYNDDVMANTLRTLRAISQDDDMYSMLSPQTREKAAEAYRKGIDCILKTQITLTLKDGSKILTAWCQQHSYETLAPAWAREFEPPSVCTTESAKVVEFLMEEKNPSPAVKNAIRAACTWLNRDDVRIHGKKLVRFPAPGEKLSGHYYDFDQKMVDDSSAPDMWARFYALDASFDVVTGARKPIQGTYPEVNTPVWCDRLCIYRETFNDISKERRNGYGYTNTGIEKTLKKYEKWKKVHLD